MNELNASVQSSAFKQKKQPKEIKQKKPAQKLDEPSLALKINCCLLLILHSYTSE